jgi:hypothetical protein
MRDLAVSDTIVDRWAETNTTEDDKSAYETKLLLSREYERELDTLYLQVFTASQKQSK